MSLLFHSIISLLCFIQVSDSWKLEKSVDGIQVYTKRIVGEDFDQVKVVAKVKATLSEVTAALEDLDNQTKWVYSTQKVELIESINEGHFIYHYYMDMPFPASDRDAIIEYSRYQDSDSKKVFTTSNTINPNERLSKKFERIKYFKTTYELTPLSSEEVEITYVLKADPGVNLPAWMINLFTTKGPYKSMVSLVQLLEKGNYKNHTVGGVSNF